MRSAASLPARSLLRAPSIVLQLPPVLSPRVARVWHPGGRGRGRAWTPGTDAQIGRSDGRLTGRTDGVDGHPALPTDGRTLQRRLGRWCCYTTGGEAAQGRVPPRGGEGRRPGIMPWHVGAEFLCQQCGKVSYHTLPHRPFTMPGCPCGGRCQLIRISHSYPASGTDAEPRQSGLAPHEGHPGLPPRQLL